MEEIGVIETVGQAFSFLVGSNTFAILLSVLWISALLSSAVDNIPVVKVLLPIVSIMSGGYTPAYYSLTLGAGLGDNLTPLGDTIIVRSITEEHGQRFSNSLFFRIGFKASLIHLITISIYYTILYYVAIGLIIILILGLLIFFLIFFRYRKNKKDKRDKELMV
jgi:Na+/H+ antiporter NhaD/arsenite permease-like protein